MYDLSVTTDWQQRQQSASAISKTKAHSSFSFTSIIRHIKKYGRPQQNSNEPTLSTSMIFEQTLRLDEMQTAHIRITSFKYIFSQHFLGMHLKLNVVYETRSIQCRLRYAMRSFHEFCYSFLWKKNQIENRTLLNWVEWKSGKKS